MKSLILALFAAVVVTVGVELWRCASKRKRGAVSNHTQGATDHGHAADEISHPRVDHDVPAWEDQNVPDIFLSHSGRQKSFVENLYNALGKANHTSFFDKHTLKKGVPFPPHIDRAARGCKLGVVVLSDDFLHSKWPMLELELLVKQRGPNARVLPLFFKLAPHDLKSLSRWQKTWKSQFPECENRWTQAVKALKTMSGEVFSPGTSEDAYIQRVVRIICNLLPNPISYDLSPIKGQQRLAKVADSHFQKVWMLGLHGVGGLGKTTICKMMVNFYNSQYLGRSCLIEFPSDGDDRTIVQECQNALKALTDLSNEHVVSNARDFDQVVQLLTENLSRHDVFLAIDNVWESSREKAERILGVGFSTKSKILLTSRSEQVLKELVEVHRNTHVYVCPLPCPEREEAFEIFQETFRPYGDLSSLGVERNQLDCVLDKCCFQGVYHPLALKALSQFAKRACADEPHLLPLTLTQISNREGLESVDEVIKLNYENLPEHKQRMFLDIVAVVMKAAPDYPSDVQVTHAKALHWLSVLYSRVYSETKIRHLIYQLSLDGLIQIEKDGRSETMITVHDLYSDLAKREATSSSRFFMHGSEENIEWERLERVILMGADKAHFFEKLQQKECRKLQVVYGAGIICQSEIDIRRMPSLCILKLWGCTQIRGIKNWSAAERLAIVELRNLTCSPPVKLIPSLPCLEELVIEDVKRVKGPPNLNGCQHLKKLVLTERSVFINKGQKYSEVYFNSLTNLESLHIRHFHNSTGVLDIHALVNLKLLHVKNCDSVRRIAGLDALKKLQEFHVSDVELNLLNLSGLNCVERLVLCDNASMEEVGGLSPALKEVEISDCGSLRKIPDLSGSTCLLEKLLLSSNAAMEEVGGIGPALKEMEIWDCGALKKMPDLSCVTCLERLVLCDNASMEEVGGLSPALKEVHIWGCGALK